MPTSKTFQLPPPKSWQEFQDMTAALFAEEWKDPNAKEHGRNGQRQHGVDVYGQRNGAWCGVQCKGRRRWPPKALTVGELNREADEARKFDPPLAEFTVVTTLDDDVNLQARARHLTDENRRLGLFPVHVIGWGEFERRFCRHENLLEEFYPSFGFGQEGRLKEHVSAETKEVKSHVTHELAPVIAFIQAQAGKQPVLSGDDAPVTRGDMQRLFEAVLASQGPTIQSTMPPDELSSNKRAEDVALHERIDAIRDLMDEGEAYLARKQLLAVTHAGRAVGKPYAQFRIQSNLASVCLFLGEFDEAISGYEAAFRLRPDEPHAKANLALARMFQDRFDESMQLAQEALAGPEPVEAAVGYLLQAAARSDWTGDPESLIPEVFKGSCHADLGMADFLRRRECPGWENASLELAARHSDTSEFWPIEAVAALSLAIKGGNTTSGGVGPIPFERLNQIADRMQAFVRRMLRLGFADEHDRVAHLNNACVLLRVCDRYVELVDLLRDAGALADIDPNVRRLRALALVRNDRLDEAIGHLETDDDPENRVLHGDLVGTKDPLKGIELIMAVDESLLDPRLRWTRWHIVAQLSLAASAAEPLKAAAGNLRSIAPGDPEAAVIDALSSRLNGMSQEEVREKLLAAAALIDASSPMHARFFVADQLRNCGLHYEASTLLDGTVDMGRPSPAVQLYLMSLAQARRDARFITELSNAENAVREDPFVLWLEAQHAWNTGDVQAAETAIDALIRQSPENLHFRLFKIDLLGRLGRNEEIRTELDAPLEALPPTNERDVLKLIALLGHSGFLSRAGRLAYRVYLERQNDPAAWKAIFRLLMNDVQHPSHSSWNCAVVSDDAAVDISYDDGGTAFFIVEPDPELCGKSADSLEPSHPLVRSMWGMSKGAKFVGPTGRIGTVTEIRHKVVAQLHRVLRDFGDRFPGVRAFEKLDIGPTEPNGLDNLKELLKKQNDYSKEATAPYGRGEISLGMLALSLQTDQVEAAARAVVNEGYIKVAVGIATERDAAHTTLISGSVAGATLDHLSFWTAWCIGAVDILKGVFGNIRVPRSVFDELIGKADEARRHLGEGRRSASFQQSEIQLTEFSPDYVRGEVEHIEGAIHWLQANAEVSPVILGDDVPPALREIYINQHSPMMDALLLSMRTGTIYVTEDLWMRQLAASLGYGPTSWMHAVVQFAKARRIADRFRCVKMTAHLIESGQSYIGVTGSDLLDAVRMAPSGTAPGEVFERVIRPLGGKTAHMPSHGGVVVSFLTVLWRDPSMFEKRKAATSLVMRRLLRERHSDYGAILRAVLLNARNDHDLVEFLVYWARGHFIPAHEIFGQTTPAATHQSSPEGKRKGARRRGH